MDTAKQSYLDGKKLETYNVAKQYFETEKWSPWYFNQVIGWLRLFVFGKSIKAEYYFIDAKRISKLVKHKRYLYKEKAFELNPGNSDSSTDIYKKIRDTVIRLNSEKPFEGRYIDLEKFDNIGTYVNWRTILNLE